MWVQSPILLRRCRGLPEPPAAATVTLGGMDNTVIECTNCGGDGAGLQFLVTLGALAVAALALLLNFVQFRERRRKARARARFDVELRSTCSDEDGVLRAPESRCAVRVEVGITNVGDLAATTAAINAFMPQQVRMPRWCGPNGEEKRCPNTVSSTSESLRSSDGREHEAKFLALALEEIRLKVRSVVLFQFDVEIPDEGRCLIPVRVHIDADELPDDARIVEKIEIPVERMRETT